VNSEGGLVVRLEISDGRVSDVSVTSSHPSRAAGALAGRTPDAVRRAVSHLFTVCGVAHGVACSRAIEAALGEPEGGAMEAARDAASLAEAAASHAWQIALAWREAAGLEPDLQLVTRARRAVTDLCVALFGAPRLAASLLPSPAWDAARAAVDALASLLGPLATSESPLERVVEAAGRAGFGASPSRLVAAPPPAIVGGLLANNPGFADRPELDGAPVEVGAYASHRMSDAVQRVVAGHGEGLLARLVARRMAALADVQRAGERLEDAVRSGHAHEPRTSPAGCGVGGAVTARGPLIHWVRADGSGVHACRTVSPTDWTFHPRGAMRQALLGGAAGPTLARDAGWLVLALDPCLAWRVERSDA